jgi:hypothetical protein
MLHRSLDIGSPRADAGLRRPGTIAQLSHSMKSALRWGILTGSCGLLVWLVTAKRADLVLWLEPSFRVTAVDLSKKQMTLQRENHRYVVDCAAVCTSFGVGKSYRLQERGGVMKYRGIEFRILEEQIQFQTGPGGHG